MHKPVDCPSCHRPIDLRSAPDWTCPFCHNGIAISDAYNRNAALFTLAGVILVGAATHDSEAGGTWLLWTILSALPLWFLFLISVPPSLQVGQRQPRLTIVGAYLASVFSIFGVGVLGLGGAYMVLGASRAEVQEHMVGLSLPVGWISPNFFIMPGRSFLDVCGILLGNSFFYGLVLFGCFRVIHWILQKNRPTRLSISDTSPTEDDLA